jgi:hypothetical protein
MPIIVNVNWVDGDTAPTVDQNPITVSKAQGATVIKWQCGANVASFVIAGLDASVFTGQVGIGIPPNPNSPPYTQYQVTDTPAGAATTYNYTVTATHKLGHSASHDPKIENGG